MINVKIKLNRNRKVEYKPGDPAKIQHIKDVMDFLNPEMENEEVLERLIAVLSLGLDDEFLMALVRGYDGEAEKKMEEVNDLYADFFSADSTDNNN